MGVRGAQDQRAATAHFLVQQADRVMLEIIGAKAVGADKLGEAFRLMRIGFLHRAHFVQDNLRAGFGGLPRGLGTG